MTGPAPTHYEIRINGSLDGCWANYFQQLRLEYSGADTVLVGPITDQAALYGVLDRIRDLGLTLVSVRQIDSPTPSHDATA